MSTDRKPKFLRSTDESGLRPWDDAQIGEAVGIVCPKCGDRGQHQGTPEIRNGYNPKQEHADWNGAGIVVVVPMSCERCQEEFDWELCIGFHKGDAVLFAREKK